MLGLLSFQMVGAFFSMQKKEERKNSTRRFAESPTNGKEGEGEVALCSSFYYYLSHRGSVGGVYIYCPGSFGKEG